MHWFTSYLVQPQAKPRVTTGTDELAAAARDYNRDNQRDWGTPGKGTCPICGHHDCFGNAGGKLAGAGRWACFSANHGNIGRRVRTDKGAASCMAGDALDVDAYQHHRTPVQHLLATGYLKPHARPAETAPERKAPVRTTTDTPEINLGHSVVSDLTAYLADFLRERRAVLAIENPTWTPRQVNAEARRLLAVIQERERGARHA